MFVLFICSDEMENGRGGCVNERERGGRGLIGRCIHRIIHPHPLYRERKVTEGFFFNRNNGFVV